MADEVEEGLPLPPELANATNNSWLFRRSRTPSPVRERRNEDKMYVLCTQASLAISKHCLSFIMCISTQMYITTHMYYESNCTSTLFFI